MFEIVIILLYKLWKDMNNLAQRYSIKHEIAYYECDINQQMTLPSLIQVMIKASEEQSDRLNRGSSYVNQLNLGWVITNYEIEVKRLPLLGEKIIFSTLATAYNKYFCYRDFFIEDEAGNCLVTVSSVFVLMDLSTRKIKAVDEEIIAPYESEKIKKIKRFNKMQPLSNPKTSPFKVRFYDIDSNKHVNNAIYFNWLLDVLGYEFLSTHTIKNVNIRFDKEIEFGNVVDSYYETEITDNKDQIISRHQVKVSEELCCEAEILWNKL